MKSTEFVPDERIGRDVRLAVEKEIDSENELASLVALNEDCATELGIDNVTESPDDDPPPNELVVDDTNEPVDDSLIELVISAFDVDDDTDAPEDATVTDEVSNIEGVNMEESTTLIDEIIELSIPEIVDEVILATFEITGLEVPEDRAVDVDAENMDVDFVPGLRDSADDHVKEASSEI